jgi:hypothetical protein
MKKILILIISTSILNIAFAQTSLKPIKEKGKNINSSAAYASKAFAGFEKGDDLIFVLQGYGRILKGVYYFYTTDVQRGNSIVVVDKKSMEVKKVHRLSTKLQNHPTFITGAMLKNDVVSIIRKYTNEKAKKKYVFLCQYDLRTEKTKEVKLAECPMSGDLDVKLLEDKILIASIKSKGKEAIFSYYTLGYDLSIIENFEDVTLPNEGINSVDDLIATYNGSIIIQLSKTTADKKWSWRKLGYERVNVKTKTKDFVIKNNVVYPIALSAQTELEGSYNAKLFLSEKGTKVFYTSKDGGGSVAVADFDEDFDKAITNGKTDNIKLFKNLKTYEYSVLNEYGDEVSLKSKKPELIDLSGDEFNSKLGAKGKNSKQKERNKTPKMFGTVDNNAIVTDVHFYNDGSFALVLEHYALIRRESSTTTRNRNGTTTTSTQINYYHAYYSGNILKFDNENNLDSKYIVGHYIEFKETDDRGKGLTCIFGEDNTVTIKKGNNNYEKYSLNKNGKILGKLTSSFLSNGKYYRTFNSYSPFLNNSTYINDVPYTFYSRFGKFGIVKFEEID